MARKKREGEPLSSTEVLQSLFERPDDPLSDQFLRWKIWRQWESIVGASLSQASEPVGYLRGTLYIWVKNSVWMQQLVFIKEPLKEKVNRHVGRVYVKKVHLTLDRRSVPQDLQQKRALEARLGSLWEPEAQEREEEKLMAEVEKAWRESSGEW
ncbi:MAG: DUF721 domain-containing protein [Bdellovibrio sp.]